MADCWITGLGLACGLTPETFCDYLKEGKKYNDSFEPDMKKFFTPEELHKMRGFDKISTMAVIAAEKVLSDANAHETVKKNNRAGVVIGNASGTDVTNISFLKSIASKCPIGARPAIFPYTTSCIPAGQIAIKNNIKGPLTTFSNGRTSGIDAIGYSADLIEENKAHIVICGAMNAIDEKTTVFLKKKISRLGEGAALLVMENSVTATKRETVPYAIIDTVKSKFCLSVSNLYQSISNIINSSDADMIVVQSSENLNSGKKIISIDKVLGDTVETSGALSCLVAAFEIGKGSAERVLILSWNRSGHLSMAELKSVNK